MGWGKKSLYLYYNYRNELIYRYKVKVFINKNQINFKMV